MDVTLNLTPELGRYLLLAARHQDLSVDAHAVQRLDRYVPGEGHAANLVLRRAAAGSSPATTKSRPRRRRTASSPRRTSVVISCPR